MASKKTTALQMVGKKVKLNQAGITAGYMGSFYNSTGPFKVLKVIGTTAYLDIEHLRASYPAGYPIAFMYIELCEPDTVESLEENIKDFNKTIEDAQADIKLAEQKIKFMKDNNLKEFGEDDFKAYAILSIIDDPATSQIEKAKAIAKLVNQ